MKLSQYAKTLGVTYRTAWNHFNAGLIEGAYKLPTGTIIVPDHALRVPTNTGPPPKIATYARVSSSQNKTNLATQSERLKSYCAASGLVVDAVVTEIGSGLSDQRPKLNKLLADSTITLIVVEHKDRLTRFGFHHIEALMGSQGREIRVLNLAETQTEDLMQDLISVITSFVARYYGRRRSKRKTEKIIALLEDKG